MIGRNLRVLQAEGLKLIH